MALCSAPERTEAKSHLQGDAQLGHIVAGFGYVFPTQTVCPGLGDVLRL